MQPRLNFQVAHNYRLLYDQIFDAVNAYVKDGTLTKGLESLNTIDITQRLESFKQILQRRDAMIALSANQDTNEEEYRQKLITPLLTQVLGYEIEALRPEQSLKDFGRIDDLYSRDDRLLPIESKKYGRMQGDGFRITKRSNTDPIFQITSYLKGINYKLYERKQTHMDAPYAILTDGLERRLYYKPLLNNDIQPSCVVVHLDQLDLEDDAMVLEALKLFTIFFSEQATRRTGILDQIFGENETRALAIKDQLGKQVYDAVEYIANGIHLKISKWDAAHKIMVVEHYKKHFSGYETDSKAWLMKVLYHESLVYLFRIIFGLYAEDRGLLEAVHIQYGLKEGKHNLLTDIQEKFQNTHGGDDRTHNEYTYQFTQNEDVHLEQGYFGPINDKYNGGLFDPKRHPLLAEFDINDRYFLRAVDYLMRTQDPYDKKKLATISYAQLDVRHLGTIYENLLEFSLIDNNESDAEILPLRVVNDKGERKATGSYYTPDYIVEYIVQQTVGSKIDTIVKSTADIPTQCEQIMSLTVCDPAMGSGHFLIEVITYIDTRIQELLSEYEGDSDLLSKHYTKSQIAARCVYGVDINYLAVELAKVVMRIKTFEEDTPLQFLDANLKWGNSLIGTTVDEMFESDKMKNLNQLFNDMQRASHKATQAVQKVASSIDEYIAGASSTTLDIETQKKQIKLKESLFELISKRYYSEVQSLSDKLGDNLPGLQGLDYKETSKRKVAHIQTQRDALQDEYGDLNPFEDWKELRDFYQIGVAAYNARYLLTVPLALEFLPESRDAINLHYASKVSAMLGKAPTDRGNNTDLITNNIHLPSTYPSEASTEMTIQQAVDTIIQDINPFHWELEFPTVFAKGGFDCVVGNPPYVSAINMNSNDREFLGDTYSPYTHGSWDLYILFLILGTRIINEHGMYSWIIPNKLLIQDYGKKTYSYLKENGLHTVINMSEVEVFKGVSVYPIILLGDNNKNHLSHQVFRVNSEQEFMEKKFQLEKKIKTKFKILGEIDGIKIGSGLTGFEAKKVIPLLSEGDEGIDFIVSGNIDPYFFQNDRVPYMKTIYTKPKIKYDSSLISDGKRKMYNNAKIVVAGMTKVIESFYSDRPLGIGVGCYAIYEFGALNPKYLLSLLNSKFLSYFLINNFKDKHLAGGYLAINKSTIQQLPIPEISKIDQQPFIDAADTMLQLHADQHTIISAAHRLIIRKYEIEKLSRKIEKFYELDFVSFLKELTKKNKALKTMKLDDEQRLEERFLDQSKQINDYQEKIDRLDEKIDTMVFDLYELSREEREVVLEG